MDSVLKTTQIYYLTLLDISPTGSSQGVSRAASSWGSTPSGPFPGLEASTPFGSWPLPPASRLQGLLSSDLCSVLTPSLGL